jgi:probable HAF family extracellular repeat protein
MRSFGETRTRLALRSWRSCVLVFTVVTLVVAGAGAGKAAPPAVQAKDLGTLGGGTSSAALITDSGKVVGWSQAADGMSHVFSWTAASGMVDLGAPGEFSDIVGINESGQIAGNILPSYPGVDRAYVWTPGVGMADLGTLGGGDYSHAAAMNASGEVVGTSAFPCPTARAFAWTAAGGMVNLGADGMGRCPQSGAAAVSDSGLVAGWSQTASGFAQAVMFNGGPQLIGTLDPLDGTTYSIGNSYAVAVSDSGQVVGRSETPDGSWRAFSWTDAGGIVDLGVDLAAGAPVAVNNNGMVVGSTSDGRGFSWTAAGGMVDLGGEPFAVNDEGQVVGTSGTRAFSWTTDGGVVDLGTLGGRTSGATAVNEAGQMAGWSETLDGQTHAALWTLSAAVPFASLSASAVVAAPAGAGNDTFVLNAGFRLGSASNGIDPIAEPVTIQLGSTTMTMPTGSFGGSAHAFVFTGHVASGRLIVTIRPTGASGYRLTATGSGYDLASLQLPLSVQVTIGDDTGNTDAKAVIAPLARPARDD